MQKSFPNLAAAAGVETIQSEDGAAVSLDSGQSDAVEASIAAMSAERDSLKARVAELEATVADLRKAPADNTSDVVEASKSDPDIAPEALADALYKVLS